MAAVALLRGIEIKTRVCFQLVTECRFGERFECHEQLDESQHNRLPSLRNFQTGAELRTGKEKEVFLKINGCVRVSPVRLRPLQTLTERIPPDVQSLRKENREKRGNECDMKPANKQIERLSNTSNIDGGKKRRPLS
ncbi:uncharacterized [Tachysurus ichikawai]